MKNFKNCFAFTILFYSVIFYAQVNARKDAHVSQIEEAIYKYYNSVGGYTSRWNLQEVQSNSRGLFNQWPATYRKICPPKHVFVARDGLITRDIMSESQNCVEIPMEILHGFCSKTGTLDNGTRVTKSEPYQLVRGPNGEVYKVSKLEDESPCRVEIKTLSIERCVHNGEGLSQDVSMIESFLFQQSKKASDGWSKRILDDIMDIVFPKKKEWSQTENTSPNSTCKLLHPDGYSKIWYGELPVLLESQKCSDIQMQILKCIIGDEHPSVYHYAKDLNNEVYKVDLTSSSECRKSDILLIRKRLLDSSGDIVRPVCPNSLHSARH